jgi:hypothetical protein
LLKLGTHGDKPAKIGITKILIGEYLYVKGFFLRGLICLGSVNILQRSQQQLAS